MEIITTVPTPPRTTFSIDTQVYLGQNQIRRNTGRNTTLYVGDTTVDRFIMVPAADSYTVQENLPIGGLILVTPGPITVTLDDLIVLPIQKLLVLDTQTIRKIHLENLTGDDIELHLSYIL